MPLFYKKMTTMKTIPRISKRLLSSWSQKIQRNELWTPDNIVKSPFKEVVMSNNVVTEHVWKDIDRWSDKTALVCAVTKQSYTFKQLHKHSKTLAANLRKKMKIQDGDVVCVMMPNSPDYALITLGSLEAGTTLTTVNPIYTAHELQRQINLTNPKLVIGSPATLKVIKEAFVLNKQELPIIISQNPNETLPEGTISLQELATEDNVDLSILNKVKRSPEDVAILPCSSGTTGLPKGVELTHRNIVVNCLQQDSDGVAYHRETTASHQDATLGVLPFYHIYGLVIIMLHKLSVGAKVVSLPKFQPDTFPTIIKDNKVSLFYAAPPLILFVGSNPHVKKEHLETVECVMSGAAPLAKRDIMLMLDKMKPSADFMQLYGSTEMSPLATAMYRGSTNHVSVGYPVANTELEIVDSNNKTLGPNEIGEVLIRGPQIMKGYRNNPKATQESITEDGWYRSGDLGFLDKSGALSIADRLKELIKVKGYQVPPAELEGVLKEHPAVLDAAVVGIPDPRTGEAPKAFIVLKEGQKENTKDIQEFVKERVAEYKRIKDVVYLDILPKNPSGKILRRVLKEKYC